MDCHSHWWLRSVTRTHFLSIVSGYISTVANERRCYQCPWKLWRPCRPRTHKDNEIAGLASQLHGSTIGAKAIRTNYCQSSRTRKCPPPLLLAWVRGPANFVEIVLYMLHFLSLAETVLTWIQVRKLVPELYIQCRYTSALLSQIHINMDVLSTWSHTKLRLYNI